MKNFCRLDADPTDVFDPADEIQFFHHGIDLSDIAVLSGLFPSKTQARKNGWVGPIPAGWSDHGSRKNRIFLWNPELDQHVWDHPCWKVYDETSILDWSVR